MRLHARGSPRDRDWAPTAPPGRLHSVRFVEHQELQRVKGDLPAAATPMHRTSEASAADTGMGWTTESERLARRFFSLFQQGETAKVLELVHPELERVLMTRPGEVLRGREEAEAFLNDIATQFIELVADEFMPQDDERVVVEGRRRTIDEIACSETTR